MAGPKQSCVPELLTLQVSVENGKVVVTPDEVTSEEPFTLIRLQLGLGNGKQAFAMPPLLWADEHERPLWAVPAAVDVHRESSHVVSIVDLHTGAGRYHFHVVVVDDGKILVSEDPTIINKKPPGAD